VSKDFDTRVSRIAALGEPVRRALYRFVGAQGKPVSRDEAAEGVGVPRHVAKFHLDRLEEDGLTLANCPFHALAKDYTGLVCGMNLDIVRGMLDELPGEALEARLDPAPDRCCVRVCERRPVPRA
jgi:predicted ArsR family transcriptional regulator